MCIRDRTGGGGGGAGLGGAIFLQGGALNVAGSLTINGSSVSGGAGAGGAGGGSAFGSGLFLDGIGVLSLNPSAGQTVTIAGDISDTYGSTGAVDDPYWGLDQTGAGTTILSGKNNYAGATKISAGTLSVSSDANLGTSGTPVNLSAGTLLLTGTSTFNRDLLLTSGGISVAAGQTATWSGLVQNLANPAALKVNGGGTLALSNTANTYGLDTYVTGNGEVIASADGSLGLFQTGSAVHLGDATSGGALGFASSFSTARDIVLGAGGGTLDAGGAATAATVSGVVSGNGSLTKAGAGSLLLTGPNTYTGATSVAAGTLTAGNAAAFGGSRSLFVNGGGAIDFNGYNQTFFSLSGTGTIALTSGASLTTGGNNSSSAFDGSLTGSGGVVKSGTGTLTLSGTSTYSGATNVTGGTLVAGSAGAFGASRSLSVSSGATTDFNGFSQTFYQLTGAGTVALNGGAGLTVGGDNSSSLFAGALTGSGYIVKAGGGTLTLSGSNTYAGSTEITGGTLVAGSAGAFGASRALSVSSGATANFNGFSQTFYKLSRAGTIALNGGALLNTGGDNSSSSFDGSLTGSGGVVKTGSGTLTLSGANTFSGGLTLSSGTVSVSSDTNLGASNGTLTVGSATGSGTLAINSPGSFLSSRPVVVNAGGFIVDTSASTDAVLGGVISGAGGVTKTGAGALTLAGVNTFAGSTQVLGGKVKAGRSDVFATSTLVSLSGGTVLDLNGFGQNIGTLTGTGTLVLGGGARITLGGNNSSSLFAGAITGNGGLTKSGNGVLTLTGGNSYGGGTSVQGGTLSGNTGSLQGAILNNASVIFDQNSNGTYAGTMSGSGALFKNGSGAVTLTGGNSYSGGTLVSGGSLIGDTTSLQGAFVNNAALAFNQSGDGAFKGAIGGTGTLRKLGTGTLTLNDPTPMTGLTTIDQGRLVVNAAMAGSVSVSPLGRFILNGILGGGVNVASQGLFTMNGGVNGSVVLGSQGVYNLAGVIGGNLDISGSAAVSAPGSQAASFNAKRVGLLADTAKTVPSLVVNGNFASTPGSTLAMTVTDGGAPPIVVSGSASLVGTHLSVTIDDPNPARAATYVALTAAKGLTVNGTDVSSPSTSLVPVLKVNADSLMLTLLNLNVPLGGVATAPNAASVGRGFDAIKFGATGDLGGIVRELTALDDERLNRALKSLSGEIHASAARMAQVDSLVVTDLVRNQLSDAESDSEENPGARSGPRAMRPWVQMSGEHINFKSGDFSGGSANVGGGASGVDFKPSSSWTVGGGAALSLGGLSLSEVSGSSQMTAPRAFAYSGFGFGPFHFHGGGSAAKSKTSTQRNIQFAAVVRDSNGNLVPLSNGVDRNAESDQSADSQDTWSELQGTKKFGLWTLDSKVGIRAARLLRNPFSESGADSVSLAAQAEEITSREANLDVHLFKRKGNWRPNILMSYRHESGDQSTAANLNFEGRPDSQFEVQGVSVPMDTFQGLFGLTARIFGLEYTVEYETKQSREESHNAFHFRMRFR